MSNYGYSLSDRYFNKFVEKGMNLNSVKKEIYRTSDLPLIWRKKPRKATRFLFSALSLPEHLADTSSLSPFHLHRLDMAGVPVPQEKVVEMWHSWRYYRTVTNPLAKEVKGSVVDLRTCIMGRVGPQIIHLPVTSPFRTRPGLETDAIACT